MMQYTYLGQTGTKVSRLCLGMMNFAHHTSERECFRMMDEALDMGMNFFDTADAYYAGLVARRLKPLHGKFARYVVFRHKTILSTFY